MANKKPQGDIFDIRNIIGLLLAIYGVILLGVSFFADKALAKTGGVDANLWAGLALLVSGAIFMLWAWIAPVIVAEGGTPTTTGPQH